jgi:hypothetical protein
MKIVLRTVLADCRVEAGASRRERTRRRGITISPALGALVVLRDRTERSTGDTRPAPAREPVAA